MRNVKTVAEPKKAKAAVVPKTKSTRKDDKVVFRTVHPGLVVLVKQSVKTELGGGSYSITQPKFAEFENMGNYGECVCDEEVAKVLREKAAYRDGEKLPPKYVEVERHVESGP